jgi:ketosteroid isomerase-like protein
MPIRGVAIAPFFLFVTFAALAQSGATSAHDDAHAKDRAYIHQAESDWAESTATNDVAVLERILADDFVGVDIDGSHYSKADAIRDYRTKPAALVSNHLNEVAIRFYGDAAVAQGSESWKKKDGTLGKFVWTDTWIKRDGTWRVVAAEDLVPPTAPAGKP